MGELNKGVYVLMNGLDYERCVLSAGPVGIMQACVDVAFTYVHERKQFDQKIGTFQVSRCLCVCGGEVICKYCRCVSVCMCGCVNVYVCECVWGNVGGMRYNVICKYCKCVSVCVNV